MNGGVCVDSGYNGTTDEWTCTCPVAYSNNGSRAYNKNCFGV